MKPALKRIFKPRLYVSVNHLVKVRGISLRCYVTELPKAMRNLAQDSRVELHILLEGSCIITETDPRFAVL